MRVRLLIAGVAVAVVVGGGLLVDNRNGAALDAAGGVATGLGKAHKGDDVYFWVPLPTNRSGRALELVAVEPDHTSTGFEFAEARIYDKDDFPGGNPVGLVATATGPDFTKLRSTPVAGRRIPAHADLGDLIYLHFRITGEQWPLTSTGVRVSYHRGLRDHTQILESNFSVGDSPNP